jgi:hypothetical protein
LVLPNPSAFNPVLTALIYLTAGTTDCFVDS